MKISQEDPILTAYALGELDESSRASVARALENDEALAREGAAISSLAALMSETLRGENYSLGEKRRDEIFKAGRRPDAEVLVLDHRRQSRRQSLLAVLGVAAVVVAGFVGLSRFQTSGPRAAGVGEAANAGGLSPSLSDREVPGPEGLVIQTGQSGLLPLTIQAVDPSFVEKAISDTGELPSPDLFKIDEWVNAGVFESSPLLKVANVGVSAELGPCSWDAGKALLLVQLKSMDQRGVSVKATLNFNPEKVASSRLLGTVDSAELEQAKSSLLNADQTLLYLVHLLPGSEPVGSLDLDVEDEATGYLPLLNAPREEEKISDDFAMARVFAEFAQWGASENRDPATLGRLAETARELLGKVSDEKARYALDMILLSEETLKK